LEAAKNISDETLSIVKDALSTSIEGAKDIIEAAKK